MRILGSVESIGAVQGIPIITVREFIFIRSECVHSHQFPTLDGVMMASDVDLEHVVCVLLPQAGLMRPVGSKLVSGVINN
mgnify:CR=1 FL=1